MENRMKKLLITLPVFFYLTAVSCNDDDEPDIPVNSIMLNMMVGDSQATIGGSDVYINSAINFTTSQCGIADLGKKGGFDKSPDLTQIGQEVAVTPGHFYQIVNGSEIRFVAGARAYPVDANYYNVFVDSWIYDKNNDINGAKVSYAECYPAATNLPEWNSDIELSMSRKTAEGDTESVEYSFPKGCRIDDNIEVYDYENSSLKDNLDIKLDGNSIIFSNSAWTPRERVKVIILVRHESTYTRVIMNVESTNGL